MTPVPHDVFGCGFLDENMVTANVFSVHVLGDVEIVVRVGEGHKAETLALSGSLVPDNACLDHRRMFGGGLEQRVCGEGRLRRQNVLESKVTGPEASPRPFHQLVCL